MMIPTLKTWTVTQTNVDGKHKKCQNIFGQNMKPLYVINKKNHSSSVLNCSFYSDRLLSFLKTRIWGISLERTKS
jgi:hypothetical protein